MNESIYKDGKINYSKFLSALFSSVSMFILAMLCILNNLSLDLYSTFLLLKVTIPGALSFWVLGYVIGKKLDGLSNHVVIKKAENEQKAYEIPSMFGPVEPQTELFSTEETDAQKEE